jgi:AcrR family transcriptional regulator
MPPAASPSSPASPARTRTERGQARREQLLDAASALVAERGFHSVGILEIGAAAGVSGSAIYRHFASKQDILVAVLDRVIDALLAGAQEVTATIDDPAVALNELVDRHVAFALGNRAVIAVYDQESHNLPPAARTRLRRNQRAYATIWVDTLVALSPALERQAAGVAVHGVFGLVNSVSDYSPRLSDVEVGAILRAMAHAGLAHAGLAHAGLENTGLTADRAGARPSGHR